MADLTQRLVIVMIDGFDMAYWDAIRPPHLFQMARDGFFKPGRCIFPSFTNANNVSIACACWPAIHGVTTNCYFDEASGRARFLEDASFLCTPTIFERARDQGVRSALLTCKSKTTLILGTAADPAIAAEAPTADIIARYGSPPAMYSAEINYWLMDIGLDLLENQPDIGLLYLHTTDYPMHMWAPDADPSHTHLLKLDEYIGQIAAKAPDATIIVTADHGMNAKSRCYDLSKICAGHDTPVRFAVSPIADRLVKHHRGFGGVSYVHTHSAAETDAVRQTILSLDGVEEVLAREEAASRFKLMPSRIGDLVVLPDRRTVFGDLDKEIELLPPSYRSHGSLYEMDIPLLLYPQPSARLHPEDVNVNLDLTRLFFPSSH